MRTLTIEQLATELGGKFWSKGDIKRIYLDRGYNTKKMSAKTYVYQRQDGTFGVDCTIECPSQHENWIEKEQDQIIESVMGSIANILSDTVYILVNKEGNTVDEDGKVCTLDRAIYYYTESEAQEEIDNRLSTKYYDFVTMTREAFKVDYDEAVAYEESLSLKVKLERGDKISFYSGNFKDIKSEIETAGIMDILTVVLHNDMSGHFKLKQEGDKTALEIIEEKTIPVPVTTSSIDQPAIDFTTGKKYQHNKFGIGKVIKETEEVVEIAFESVGVKQLLKKFAKLTEVA